MPKYEFYAVAKGRKPGIYSNWEDCKLQTEKFKGGPKFKGFHSKEEAQKFIDEFKEKEMPKRELKADRNLCKVMNYTTHEKHTQEVKNTSEGAWPKRRCSHMSRNGSRIVKLNTRFSKNRI